MNVLSNKSYKDYSIFSRYSPLPYYFHTVDKKYIYGTALYLSDKTTYTLYTCKKNDTFDSLALEFYNNPTLYWIICSFNRIQDPFEKLDEGTQLKIPSISSLTFDM